MDTRAYSKGYEEYYRRAENKYGVKYTRCRISDRERGSQLPTTCQSATALHTKATA
jgi:heterodisulfide reductase subunit A-like polyferredoxin